MAKHGERVDVTQKHKALHDFVGNWKVTQKLWSSPDAEPVTHRGKTTCNSILDGLATLMITEMETSDFKGMAVITYNQKESRYDLAWIDTISDQGFTLMAGQSGTNRSRTALLSEFGETATEERVWSTAVATATACLPGDAMLAASQFAVAGTSSFAASKSGSTAVNAAPQIDLSLVENKISDDQWVLEFYVPGPDGERFLVQQNTFTRHGQKSR
jgi:hypothetical protein